MWFIEKEGRDPERLIEEICEELGKGREELEFEVEEKEGFLGVFGKKVVVRARPRPPRDWELTLLAEELADTILSFIAPALRVRARNEKGLIVVGIEGEDLKDIRRRRELLESLRYLLELAVSKKARAKRAVRLELSHRGDVSRETPSGP